MNEDNFTIAIIPDTQNYADVRTQWTQKTFNIPDQRHFFFDQTTWIRDTAEELNTVMAIHMGDLVQTDYPAEWEIADRAMTTLDPVVPYAVCLGNHDMGYSPTLDHDVDHPKSRFTLEWCQQ